MDAWATSEVLAALVGAVTTLVVLLATGLAGWFRSWTARRERRRAEERSARDLYATYSDPIHRASVSLAVRLDEILRRKDQYLKGDGPEGDYQIYKFTSTLYRLGALIAWLQALRIESYALRPPDGKTRDARQKLDTAADELASVLADGDHLGQGGHWIYRDWQSAIGDVLIQPTATRSRRYEVVGFREFSRLYEHGSGEEKRWLQLLVPVFSGADSLSEPEEQTDFLRALSGAVERIASATHEQGASCCTEDGGVRFGNSESGGRCGG